jgi:hypothetical protein
MSFKKYSLFALTIFLPLGAAHAHLRNYLDTYSYYTLTQGASELELHTDLHNPDHAEDYWAHETEYEYGITDRYTIGLYGVFREGVGFTAAKVENRVRIAEPGEWFMDPAIYFEIKDANGRKDQDELEGKLILSKEIGRWNVSWNGILGHEREIKKNGDTEWETEVAMAIGAAYNGGWRVTPGVELYSAENATRITPGLYIDLMKDVRLNLGVGIGLEDKAEDATFKSILEIEF